MPSLGGYVVIYRWSGSDENQSWYLDSQGNATIISNIPIIAGDATSLFVIGTVWSSIEEYSPSGDGAAADFFEGPTRYEDTSGP
jgi:hypothetical protein